jgi:Sigma 54 modulation/S30EA ribosomal protein C terminus
VGPAGAPGPGYLNVGEGEEESRSGADSTVDEAAADMELMDYDFHLFWEAGSSQHSVLYRVGDRLRLAQVNPHPERVQRGVVQVGISPQPAARLTATDAVGRQDRPRTSQPR